MRADEAGPLEDGDVLLDRREAHRVVGGQLGQPSSPSIARRTALAAAGAGPEHVVKRNVLIVEGQDFSAGYAAFQRVWGDRPDPPVITAAAVKGLTPPDFLVQMDAIAVPPA